MEPFENVVTQHGPVVLRVCRSLLGPIDADDAWSDTFLAALRAYPTLPVGSNVLGWLVTIAHNKSIDIIRRRGRAPRLVKDPIEMPHVDPSVPSLDEELRSALDTLGPKQRAAVIYHHIAGLPYAEVGLLLHTTEAAARRSAADGIANLRKTYRKERH